MPALWFPDDSPADATANDLELVFNTNTQYEYSDGDALGSLPDAGEWDFISVVLHEIGHVLGLHHFAAGTGSNLMSASATSFQQGQTHRFIDTADLQGAIDLYSTTPEPGTLALLSLGLAGLAAHRRSARAWKAC